MILLWPGKPIRSEWDHAFFDTVASDLGTIYYVYRQNRFLAVVVSGDEENLADTCQISLRQKPHRQLCARIDDYFAGRFVFKRDLFDFSGISAFHRKIYEALAKTRFGSTLTYGQLARHAGTPKAVRAVGGAMAKNPFALLIPCHRVIYSDGALGNYSASGGTQLKKQILDFEKRMVCPGAIFSSCGN